MSLCIKFSCFIFVLVEVHVLNAREVFDDRAVLSSLVEEVRTLKLELTDTKARLRQAEETIRSLERNHDRYLLKRQPVIETYKVAFSAYLSNHSTGLHAQNMIPFDQVRLNSGNSFDVNQHMFTCPLTGIYVFQSALMAEFSDMVQTEIVKNGQGLAAMYAAGSSGSHGFDQGFNSAVVECQAGERVWVRIFGDKGNAIYYGEYSSFSGFLLYEASA